MIFSYSELASIMQEHSIMMIVAILTLAFTVGLKTIKVFLLQLILFLLLISSYFIDGTSAQYISLFIALIQVAVFLFLLFKVKKAIDYDYTLVIEKTHEVPRRITRDGNLGTRKTFF